MFAAPTTNPQLRLAVMPDREGAVVVPHGELDIATIPLVEREVIALRERGYTEICLDLSALDYFDSGGLRMLIRLDQLLNDDGCRLTVVPGSGTAARVLRITRLDERFPSPSRH
jgi:anti-sigma B factor antagonist